MKSSVVFPLTGKLIGILIQLTAATLVAIILLSLSACRGSEDQQPGFALYPDGQGYSDYTGVEVKIKEAVRKDSSVTLTVRWTNHTKYEVVYGASYSIERKEGDQWVSCAVVEDPAFIAIAYLLQPWQTKQETYDITRLFDVSKAGTYRFRASFSVSGAPDAPDRCQLWTTFTVTDSKENGQILPQDSYGVQYIRTNGGKEDSQYPQTVIIRSMEELNSYYTRNRNSYDLERKDTVYADTTIGFLDACDRYDAAFFQENYLIFVLLEEGSGSVRHEVCSVTQITPTRLGIAVARIVPEVGTADMAQWHIILQLPNSVAVKDENSVQLSVDGKTVFETDVQSGQTQEAQ